VKIVVDTSIFISVLINPRNDIGEILLNPSSDCEFASPELLRSEYFRHRKKVLKFTKMDLPELREIEFILFDAITFLSPETIPLQIRTIADEITKKTDIDDSVFIASAIYLKGKLWTLDKKLITGVRSNGFNDIITTKEVRQNYSRIQWQSKHK
jgi:predicted nucleic acid-binding protein